MRPKIFLTVVLAVFAAVILTSNGAMAADVEVYGENVYTDTDVEVCIYSDITGPNQISFGVLLTYDDSLLTINSAEKNEDVWFLGAEPYMDPETSTPGQVVFIGGKLDPDDPLSGVGGPRVLLGKARFIRTENSMPFSSPVGLDYGRDLVGPPPYKNFVATDGTVMDGAGVAFTTPVVSRERGDANEDGFLTNSDIFKVRDMINNNEYSCAADCNDDGFVTNSDIFCVRDKI